MVNYSGTPLLLIDLWIRFLLILLLGVNLSLLLLVIVDLSNWTDFLYSPIGVGFSLFQSFNETFLYNL